MTIPHDDEQPPTVTEPATPEAKRVSYLDRALWDKLGGSTSPQEMAKFWLELQCRMIEGVRRASIFWLGDAPDQLVTLSIWPPEISDGPTSLIATAKKSINEQKGVVSGHRTEAPVDDRFCCTALPFVVDGAAFGAVAIEIADRPEEALRAVMRQLQWGASWLEVAVLRQRKTQVESKLDIAGTALDFTGLLLGEDTHRTAAKALATELATKMGCELVALGSLEGQHQKVIALSHSAQFGKRMNLMRALSAAMEEASDQEAVVLYPIEQDADYRITVAHEALSRELEGATVLSIPLVSGVRTIGAISFEWGRDKVIRQEMIDLCDGVAAVAGPIIEDKRLNDRSLISKAYDAGVEQLKRLLGPHYAGRKIALCVLTLLVVFFSLVEGLYQITSPAKIEGSVQRVSVAPFDGYIASQAVRPGDTVKKGVVLATMDRRELTLELLRWTTTRQQRVAEYDQAIAKHDRAGINIVEAQIDQAGAHIALLEDQLERTEIVAAFDGIVVSGDLSQSIGATVKRGEELFSLAPLDSYRVILNVDESQIDDLVIGQRGNLKVAALLDETLPYTIERITPITEAADGSNYFRVEAKLDGLSDRLRPGMEGIAKTAAGDRLVFTIWTQELFAWLRLKLWAWWP